MASVLDATALTGLALVKSLLNNTETDTAKDNWIETIINAVSKDIEGYCSRVFSKTAYVEYYDGDGTHTLLTRQWPINSITSIYNASDEPPTFTAASLEDATYYDYDANSDGKIYFRNSVLYPGFKNVKVTYSGGYERGSGPGTTTDTLPKDLQIAAARAAARLWNDAMNKRDGVSGLTTAGGGTIDYLKDVESQVLATINRYRKPLF